MRTYKRLLSALLVLLMCVSLFPVSAIAEGEAADEAEEVAEIAEPAAAEETAEEAEEPAEAPEEPAVDAIAPQGVEEPEDEVAIASAELTLLDATGTLVNGTTYEVAVDPGKEVTLSVTASGDDLTYSWKADWEELDEDGNSITVTCSSGGPLRYDCEITDSNGNYLDVTFKLKVNSPMFLEEAAGTFGNYSYDDVAQYYNYYLIAEPGDEISLWVLVLGLSDEERADVTYKWIQRIKNDGAPMSSVDTGERDAEFPTFQMEEECSYECMIRDGYGKIIYVAFDVMEGSPSSGDSPMYLVEASGDCYDSGGSGNFAYYSYSVPVTPGSDAELWVEIGGLSDDEMDDVTYQWYIYDEDEQDYVALAGEDSDMLTVSDPANNAGYSCEIKYGNDATIWVNFSVYYSYPRAEYYYGDNYYRTAAGLPVDMRVRLPENMDESDYRYHWYSWAVNGSNQNWIYVGETDEPGMIVRLTDTMEYQLQIMDDDGYTVDYFYFYVEIVPGYLVQNLDQDYYALTSNDVVTLYALEVPAYWCVETEWKIEGDGVISIEPNGSACTVTAGENPGTSFVSWRLWSENENDEVVEHVKLRARFDVVGESLEEAVQDVYLPVTAATTNVYSDEYTQFEVLLNLKDNQIGTQSPDDGEEEEEEEEEEEAGGAIQAAWFTEAAASAAFSLNIVDDRTLEIIPNIDFAAPKADVDSAVAALGKSYTSAVTVKLKGVEEPRETTNKLTLTVKKTLPKLKASAVKFNSFIDGDDQSISISSERGIWSLRLDPDPSKTQPDWVAADTYTEDDGTVWLKSTSLTFTGERNKSYKGTLYLLVRPYPYNAEIPVAVSVKAAKSAPKLKGAGAITLNPWIAPSGSTRITATPYKNYPAPEVIKITEGKTTWPGKDSTLADAPISCYTSPGYSEWQLYTNIRDTSYFNSNPKAHTFKVTLSLGADAQGKGGVTTVVTVKTIANNAAPKLKLKGSGTIDTMIPGSPFAITWSGTNLEGLYPKFSVHLYQGKVDLGPVDELPGSSTKLFLVSSSIANKAARIYEYQPGTAPKPPKGLAYYVVADLYLELEETEELVLANAAKIKLGIKWPTERAKITTTLKASGSIDLIRPDSAVTLTPTLKNCYTISITKQQMVFSTDKAGLNVIPYDPENNIDELPFNVEDRYIRNSKTGGYDHRIVVTLKDKARGVLYTTDKFYVHTEFTTEGLTIKTTPVQIKLTKSTPKITTTVKTVQLLKNDRYSYAQIGVVVPTGYSKIRTVTLDDASEARFDLVDNGGGSVELHLDQDSLLTTKTTVKLKVFLEGNTTGKPDKLLSVAVKFI